MNNRQLAQVGLGLLGVWALLTAVAGLHPDRCCRDLVDRDRRVG